MNEQVAAALTDARALRDRKALMERGLSATEAAAIVALATAVRAHPADTDGAEYPERAAAVRAIAQTAHVYDDKAVTLSHDEAARVAFTRWLAQQRDLELTKGDS